MCLSSLYFSAEYLLQLYEFSIPPALLGIAGLFLFLLYFRCVPAAINKSAQPLLANMSLFFIPAIVAIVSFTDLISSYYLALILGIFLCTLISLALTALLAAYLMPTELVNDNAESLKKAASQHANKYKEMQ